TVPTRPARSHTGARRPAVRARACSRATRPARSTARPAHRPRRRTVRTSETFHGDTVPFLTNPTAATVGGNGCLRAGRLRQAYPPTFGRIGKRWPATRAGHLIELLAGAATRTAPRAAAAP